MQARGRGRGASASVRRVLRAMLVMLATTRAAASPSWSEHPGLAEMARLRAVVESENACALPGCSIKYNSFMSTMWRAVQRGFVLHDDAVYIAEGLQNGFSLGVGILKMRGQPLQMRRSHSQHIGNFSSRVKFIVRRSASHSLSISSHFFSNSSQSFSQTWQWPHRACIWALGVAACVGVNLPAILTVPSAYHAFEDTEASEVVEVSVAIRAALVTLDVVTFPVFLIRPWLPIIFFILLLFCVNVVHRRHYF